jgi:phage-related protein
MKEIRWIGSSRARLKEFPEDAMDDAGHQLWLIQKGLEPADWKHIPSIGLGAVELRLHSPNEYRVIYVAKFPEAIYILHAFEKKTRKTPDHELVIARVAYAEVEKKRQAIK